MEKLPPNLPLDGSLSIGEMLPDPSAIDGRKLGKQMIKDIGARYRQIQGLKPGSTSIRTPEAIEEIIERLKMGETLSSILLDYHLPKTSTFWNWCQADDVLNDRVKEAQAIGQRALKDLVLDIAAGGSFSTGDTRRDELLIKAIDRNASQRNRGEFGEQSKVSVEHHIPTVVLPTIALPSSQEHSDDPDYDPEA